MTLLRAVLLIPAMVCPSAGAATFRLAPYLQNPSTDSMTLVWFSQGAEAGQVRYGKQGSGHHATIISEPKRADALAYTEWENMKFFQGSAPDVPSRHRVTLTGLDPGTAYGYEVKQGGERFRASFRTVPLLNQSIRFIVYGDSETEPESSGRHGRWSGQDADRSYLIDQTTGYANNLSVIRSRDPDFIAIAGDLVECGGEQRDWDEFWRHSSEIAARVPMLAVPGNHEYYAGPHNGQYNQPTSEQAFQRFRTYFVPPAVLGPGSSKIKETDRFFRTDYGPVTIIGLDVANNSPHRSGYDTNYHLLGEEDPEGGAAPGFGPGTRQYAWLEEHLEDAQHGSHFTFVLLHHSPYSVGPHGWPAGRGEGFDTQSGVPVRVLTPLFLRYGVDAVLAGHDEMWERSEISGTEIKADGSRRTHTIHFYDVGTGGDDLRGKVAGLENPFQEFLAHKDAPEIWQNGVLVKGGRHYGHLEVDVELDDTGLWEAVLEPVYVFPVFSEGGDYMGSERRIYDDIVIMRAE